MTNNAVREFAIRAHANQNYSGQPYVVHLDAVVAVLKEFGHFDSALLDHGTFLEMYRREYPAFKAALKGEHHGAMWAELDRLLL